MKLNWLNKIPKTEIHLHLEGAIPHEALFELLLKYEKKPSFKNPEALKARFTYKNFQAFIDTWIWKNNFLREYEDFTFISEAIATDLSRQNIIYSEIFFSPSAFVEKGLTVQKLTEAVRQGFSRVKNITINLIADLVRDYGPEKESKTLLKLLEMKEERIIGIGIGGSEHLFPPEPFKYIYELARKQGLYTTVHAGEAAGPSSIWEAIKYLKPDRIGHCTRAIEDKKLMTYLSEHKIPIELCPISNWKTGVIANLSDHPVKEYLEAGMLLSINTDDPKMFGNNLYSEYLALKENFNLADETLVALIKSGIKATWQNDEKKERLLKAVDSCLSVA